MIASETAVQISQKSRFSRHNQFSLYRGRELQIVSHAGRKCHEYKVDLLALRAPSERIVIIAWRWWLAAMSIFLVSIGLVWLFSYLNLDAVSFAVGAGGFVVFAVVVVMSWKRGSRKQVFYARHSGVPLVTMRLGSPNKSEFKSFVKLLESQIEAVRKKNKLSRDQELAGEMRTLRRLTNDGIISLDEYENSKEVLFQKH